MTSEHRKSVDAPMETGEIAGALFDAALAN